MTKIFNIDRQVTGLINFVRHAYEVSELYIILGLDKSKFFVRVLLLQFIYNSNFLAFEWSE